jgi:predicted membrane-bound spermidine synthase
MLLTRPVLNRPRRIALLYTIFFISGFCGLIYESIWSHYLKLILGHATYAQAVVLVVFVGGLALGAWLTGRFSERIRRPILVYAAVEAAVALMAFCFQGIFERASAWASSEFLPAVCATAGACPASWLLAAALILPPSILLGTTFPLMSAGVIRLSVQPGRGLSLLYFLNSAGAALGVLGSGFVLIPAVGLPGTILLAGCCNALVATGAWVCDTTDQQRASPLTPSAAKGRTANDLSPLLAIAGVTGMSSFIYEVVWIRMLTLVVGAATHSFELMLAPFILGLAIGAWCIRDRIESAHHPLKLLAVIQVTMGLLAVATLPFYAASFDGMALALKALARTQEGYVLFNTGSGLLAAAVMLPATICAGMTLPLITAILMRNGGGERQVGKVYGINTFGAIAGVLLSVQLLIPSVGLKWSLAIAAGIDVTLGLWLWDKALRRHRLPGLIGSRAWLAVTGMAACVMLVGVPLMANIDPVRLASGVFRHGQARVDTSDRTIVFHRDGKTATVTVTEQVGGVRALLTNGKVDGATHPDRAASTVDDHTMVLLGALGPIHHPKAKTAAVIGLGTGTSSAVLLESPAIQRLDTIEIEPTIVEAAQLFKPRNAKVFDDPRSRIVIDDARAHFAKTRARYDIVVSEPSNPWVSGVSGLFTVEFYAHIAAHLAPDGHFVQWLHLYEASPELVASIVRAFAEVFPEFKAYRTNSVDIVLVARNDHKPPQADIAALDGMLGLRARLLELGISSGKLLAAHDAGRPNAIRLLANSYGAPPNSDYFPYVDQRAAADRFRGANGQVLFALRDSPVPILDFARGAPEWASEVRDASQWMPAHVRNLASSWHGHRFLQGQDLAPLEEAYLGSLLGDYALVRGWSQDCRFPRGTGPAWYPMLRVAIDVNPGLDATTASRWWRSITQGKCRNALSLVQKSWMELFTAVGARNPELVHGPAEWLLRNDPELEREGRAYLTLAAVSAHLALNRRSEAAALFQEQRAKLPEVIVESTPFRYVTMSLAAKRRQTAPTDP